jgi:hypothetical protein
VNLFRSHSANFTSPSPNRRGEAPPYSVVMKLPSMKNALARSITAASFSFAPVRDPQLGQTVRDNLPNFAASIERPRSRKQSEHSSGLRY